MTIRFHCPDCTRLLLAPPRLGGAEVRCPDCHGVVSVPDLPPPVPRARPVPVARPARAQADTSPERDLAVLFLLSFFLGSIGIDRFYMGQPVLGILKIFLSVASCGAWYLIDLILAGCGLMRDVDGRLTRESFGDEPRSACSQAGAFCLGLMCLDRLYLGFVGLGLLKLITLGGFGLWWLIDLVITGCGSMRDVNGRPLCR